MSKSIIWYKHREVTSHRWFRWAKPTLMGFLFSAGGAVSAWACLVASSTPLAATTVTAASVCPVSKYTILKKMSGQGINFFILVFVLHHCWKFVWFKRIKQYIYFWYAIQFNLIYFLIPNVCTTIMLIFLKYSYDRESSY